ncbi:hypothetical protein [Micromonospora sp. NPDC005806]|uniref:hypothetical protein n=1 Tax=Micromonospora sp. NPDC005806 TaxID=3364234 RepID=UPI0036984594
MLRGSQAAAITLSPAGEILLASATEVRPAGVARDDARQAELKLIHCADVFCMNPTVASLGLVDGALGDRDGSRPTRLVVRVDGNGRPVVAFRSPSTGAVSVAWCVTPDCARTEVAALDGPRHSGMPTPDDLALLDLGDVLDCRTGHGCDDSQPLATVHRAQGGVYDMAVEPGYPDGLYLRVGSGAWPGRATLRVCADRPCQEPERIPLVQVPPVQTVWSDRPARERWLMAVAADGRVAATDPYGQRVVVVRP